MIPNRRQNNGVPTSLRPRHHEHTGLAATSSKELPAHQLSALYRCRTPRIEDGVKEAVDKDGSEEILLLVEPKYVDLVACVLLEGMLKMISRSKRGWMLIVTEGKLILR